MQLHGNCDNTNVVNMFLLCVYLNLCCKVWICIRYYIIIVAVHVHIIVNTVNCDSVWARFRGRVLYMITVNHIFPTSEIYGWWDGQMGNATDSEQRVSHVSSQHIHNVCNQIISLRIAKHVFNMRRRRQQQTTKTR